MGCRCALRVYCASHNGPIADKRTAPTPDRARTVLAAPTLRMKEDVPLMVSEPADDRTAPNGSTRRGTSNSNRRGSSVDRRRRREYLIVTYRANVDALPALAGGMRSVPLGRGIAACRCYRCAELLTVDTVTVDRIIPGCQGGTYRRNNIRPACGTCNSETGGALGASRVGRVA